MKEPKPYLLNIITGVNAIESYIPSVESEFAENTMCQDAILMRLQDIGENLSKVRDGFPEFWNEHSIDTWIKAIGLRNIISHGYAEVSLSIIWVLVTEDLEPFKKSILSLL